MNYNRPQLHPAELMKDFYIDEKQRKINDINDKKLNQGLDEINRSPLKESIKLKQNSMLIQLGASMVHSKQYGAQADQELVEAIDQNFPHPMEADAVDWLAEVFKPVLFSMVNEKADFTSLLPSGGAASNFLDGWQNRGNNAALTGQNQKQLKS